MVTHPSAGRILAYTIVPGVIRTLCHQGSYGQGKSGKTERVREKSGILKYCSLDQLFMHYIHSFCRLLGAPPL